MDKEKLERYAEEINENRMNFINKRLVSLIVQLEDKGRTDETIYLRALELLKDQ